MKRPVTLRLGFVGALMLMACGRGDRSRPAPRWAREAEAPTIGKFATDAGLRAVSCNVHACCSALLGDKPVMFYCSNGACEWVSLGSNWNRPFAC